MDILNKLSDKSIYKKSFNVLKKHYGIFFLICVEFAFIFIFALFGDKLYVAINDNLDSNIALYKMFRDNNCWIDRTTPLPFLGGISRDLLTCGYSLPELNYWFFDTQYAYWINYIEAIAISAIGFYCIGISLRKITGKDISPNVFCVVGTIYALIGFWPHAIFAFALIPWWAFLLSELYRTRRWLISLFFIPLMYNISGPLIGVFLIFYTVMFYIGVTVKERKISKEMTISLALVLLCFVFFNYGVILQGLNGSKDTIKSFASNDGYVYSDSFSLCLSRLSSTLFLRPDVRTYHCGVSAFHYTANPVIFIFFILFNIDRKKMKVGRDFLILYNLVVGTVILNALFVVFDKWTFFRKLIPFFSGFSFERMIWLSPFVIVMGFLMVLYYLCRKGFKRSSFILVIILLLGICKNNNMEFNIVYNVIHSNYCMNIRHMDIPWYERWDSFYSTDLFDEIKKDIGYNNEWVVSFSLEPSIPQYNGFRTLDGYYSNYPAEYKLKWEKLILPTLMEDENAMDYWRQSNGQRAYIYSLSDQNNEHNSSNLMLINSAILRELGGKYVISATCISNADELGFKYIGTWKNSKYTIIVYDVCE